MCEVVNEDDFISLYSTKFIVDVRDGRNDRSGKINHSNSVVGKCNCM